jgi:hypothetical protein
MVLGYLERFVKEIQIARNLVTPKLGRRMGVDVQQAKSFLTPNS